MQVIKNLIISSENQTITNIVISNDHLTEIKHITQNPQQNSEKPPYDFGKELSKEALRMKIEKLEKDIKEQQKPTDNNKCIEQGINIIKKYGLAIYIYKIQQKERLIQKIQYISTRQLKKHGFTEEERNVIVNLQEQRIKLRNYKLQQILEKIEAKLNITIFEKPVNPTEHLKFFDF